ncbi:hypothetical protein BIW11_04905 [Tropilaelaps mercedesae]|uniref:Uncharacterized protein n=1 Tax=Tropilaelaps mercedesae TaxID=418985 RepID=A0A1V9X0D5_9ACAR|nr:hypothetical protein BIW11_04905 [Tropilaelaps mercedesae]
MQVFNLRRCRWNCTRFGTNIPGN